MSARRIRTSITKKKAEYIHRISMTLTSFYTLYRGSGVFSHPWAVSKNTYTLKRGKTGTVTVTRAGDNKKFVITAQYPSSVVINGNHMTMQLTTYSSRPPVTL